MSIAPVELRHLRFPRRLFGYRRRSVTDQLERIADAYGEVWRERADLQDRVEELDGELARHRELEEMLRKTLVSAERSVDAMRSQARHTAEQIVREAEARAREIIGEAHAERERVRRDLHRLRETEKEFRARFRSVVTSTSSLVDEYEAELAE
jgi:cell division initiation protein